MPSLIVIADSGPLIALATIQRLSLLQQLYESVLVPPAVWSETTSLPKPGRDAIASATFFKIETPSPSDVARFANDLDLGEAEALALAVLAQAKSQGLISEVKTSIEGLRQGGLFLSDHLVETVLRQLGELPPVSA